VICECNGGAESSKMSGKHWGLSASCSTASLLQCWRAALCRVCPRAHVLPHRSTDPQAHPNDDENAYRH